MTRNKDIFQKIKIFDAMVMAKLILVTLLKEQKRLGKLLKSLANFCFLYPTAVRRKALSPKVLFCAVVDFTTHRR
jgi:hypothetical protein